MRKVIQLGDKNLEKISAYVENPRDKKTQEIIRELLEVCEREKENGGGLAAPQIGENIRIFIARRVDLEEKKQKTEEEKTILKTNLWEVFINPKIVFKGSEKSTFWEGCLSVENGKLFGPVKRSSCIEIEYINQEGKSNSIEAKDYFAHILQHEMDHLDGILFIKYIKNPDNLWDSKKLDNYLDETGDFPKVV